jgi:hypothetical protein
MELMDESFDNVKVQEIKVHLTERKKELSKNTTSHRGYSVNIPKSDTLGSRFGKYTCGFPKIKEIPYQHTVAIQKLSRIDGLIRAAVMSHWYTTAQWRNQFP